MAMVPASAINLPELSTEPSGSVTVALRPRAAIPDVDLAIVDNAGGRRRRIKLPGAAAGKVRRGSGSSRHKEAMGVEHGLAHNVKARLVLQHHVAVGVEGAEDLGGVGIVDLVPNHRGSRRLKERRGLTDPDIETLPVDDIGRAHV